MDGEPNSLDPIQLPSYDAAALSFLVFHCLHDQTPGSGFEPVLTKALPEISADLLTYTFRLHPGVRFSNGRELVADDVVFSFERGCDPTFMASASAFFRNIAGSTEFGAARMKEAARNRAGAGTNLGVRQIEPTHVEGLRTLDQHTFQLRLKAPDLTAMTFMAGIGIVPREEFFRKDRPFGTHPLGTGAFVLKEWRRGVRMRLERNPLCFRAEETHIDAVEVLLNVNPTTQAMMFDRGETDFLTFFDDVDAWRWRKDPVMRHALVTVKGASPIYIALNCELPPFTNRLVRQAMNYAVNKQAVVKKLMHRAVPAQGPLPMIAKGYNPQLNGYPHDPAKARALLAEAGFPNGFKTVFWAMPGDKAALSVQEDLRAVGVQAELRLVSWMTLMESAGRRRTVPLGSLNAPATDEPKDTLDFLLNGDNITDEWSANMAFYSNAEVQHLFRTAAVATNETRRLALYQQVEELIVQDAPWIFLCHGDFEMIRQPWLKGARISPVWPPIHLENAWLDR